MTIESPYRSLMGPLIAYIEQKRQEGGNEFVNVVLPEIVPAQPGENLLHNYFALRLKAALLFQPGIVVTDVLYDLHESPRRDGLSSDRRRTTAPPALFDL